LFAQGKVGFGNDSARLFVAYTELGPTPISEGAGGAGVFLAGLYAGTTAASLSLQTAIPLTGSNLPLPGRMTSHNVTLDGIPGAVSQYFQIVVWLNSVIPAPSTIDPSLPIAGQFQTFFVGTSGLSTFTPGTSIAYPLIYAGDSTWAAEPVYIGIPEPSAFALLLLGFALQFRRHSAVSRFAAAV
jgi:hypothetical protein